MDIDPDALHRNDDPEGEDPYAGLPWNHCARFDGQSGMVWYSRVDKVPGDRIKIGDWLDGTLDHRGARAVFGIWVGQVDPRELADTMADFSRQPDLDTMLRTVMFGSGDTATVRRDVIYDVVEPESQVTPDGTPIVTAWP